ncbi:hypothetical protein [Edaphobacter aggregans]|uniref:hypothetical protein n=1 Tax=Edaphobacter aggregans TaxID=570835 RepID=UPI000558DB2E|nr:hypothetical protein [Edaphobacter aggregans]
MNRLHILLSFAIVLLFAGASKPARAQIAIYAGYSGANVSGASSDWAYGPLFGIYKQTGYPLHTVNIGGDLRGSFITRNDFHYYTGAAGPRLAFKVPVLPLRPYIEGLIGVASYNSGSGGDTTTHFNYQVAGGLDLTIFPKVDWRIVDFDYSAVSGQNVNAKILTTGLVLRLW